jgi:hypothetical protein
MKHQLKGSNLVVHTVSHLVTPQFETKLVSNLFIIRSKFERLLTVPMVVPLIRAILDAVAEADLFALVSLVSLSRDFETVHCRACHPQFPHGPTLTTKSYVLLHDYK